MVVEVSAELRNFNKRNFGDGTGRQQIVTVDDQGKVLSSLNSGEPIVMKDAILRPISSQKRQKLIDNVNYFEAQLGRLMKMAKEMRAEISSLTVVE
jgi:hypothetical protein